MTMLEQLYWEEVSIGDDIPPVQFPLPVYRLVMMAGANRDFNSIHHNSEYAIRTGAPEMYANNVFLQGMWERTVREYIGLGGVFKSLKGFRMKVFNVAGETVFTKGIIKNKWKEEEEHLVEIEVWCENSSRVITVGPGTITASLPSRTSQK